MTRSATDDGPANRFKTPVVRRQLEHAQLSNALVFSVASAARRTPRSLQGREPDMNPT